MCECYFSPQHRHVMGPVNNTLQNIYKMANQTFSNTFSPSMSTKNK